MGDDVADAASGDISSDQGRAEKSITCLSPGRLMETFDRPACCAGACGDLLNDALGQKVDLYLTGEMRHHDALKAANAGLTVVCTLHSNSERASLTPASGSLEWDCFRGFRCI